jgi:DNA-binding Xre family transcriptional regulator
MRWVIIKKKRERCMIKKRDQQRKLRIKKDLQVMENNRNHLLILGEKISKQRRKKGITLGKLAYEMEISKGNLSDLEHGKRDPRYSTLKAIAEGLEMSISQLLKDL